MKELTLENYAIFASVTIFLLWALVINLNSKGTSKVKPRPKIQPLKLFTGKNGLSERRIKEIFKIKSQ